MAAKMPKQSGAAEAAAPPPRTTAWGWVDCTLSALCSGAQHGASSQANKHARGHEERAGMEGWPPSGAPLSVAAGRRGQPPPQQMAIGPPRRRRLPVRPPRRFALARQPSKNSEARAVWRLSLGTELVRGELPVAPHGDPPPFVRHRQANAGPHMLTTARARMCPRRRAAALAARSRSLALLWRRAYLGSLRRATTSFWPHRRAMSRAVSPSLVRSDGSAPFWRRRLTIARWPWSAL